MLWLVCLVVFIVVMVVWLIGNGGTIPPDRTKWLPFIAVLILGIVVFLIAGGVIVADHPPAMR